MASSKKWIMPLWIVVIWTVALAAIGVEAQNASRPHLDEGAKKLWKPGDSTFAVNVAQSSIGEVQLGELASHNAGDPVLKAFGRQMADDHRKINDQLTAIAAGRNMTLPATMTAKQQALYDKLQNLTGRDFDKAYIAGMVKEHEQDVGEFRREVNRGQDDRIKFFASETLPVLEGHLQKIKSIHSGA